jgi:SAM-dependent methyltransferase
MNETSKSHSLRVFRKDYDRFMKPGMIGVDIGGGEDPLRSPAGAPYPTYDIDKGDAQYLDKLSDNSLDFIYSSHCLEHLVNLDVALSNWHRVLKRGGHAYITIPDFVIYEHMNWPSRYNGDHKQTFSLSLSRKFVGRDNHFGPAELTELFRKTGFKLVRMEMEDNDYNYADRSGRDQTLEKGMAQIGLVLRKPLNHEYIPGVLKTAEHDNPIVDFAAGLGDIINAIYKSKRYTYLETITQKTHVVIRSHNPFVEELFLNHPKRHLMLIHNLGYFEPNTVDHLFHGIEYGRQVYERNGLDVSKVISNGFVDEVEFDRDSIEKPIFYPSVDDLALLSSIKKLNKKYAVIQPGAGSIVRNIPEGIVIQSVKELIRLGYIVVIIGKSYTRALRWKSGIVPKAEHEKEYTNYLNFLEEYKDNIINLVDTSFTVPGTIELVKGASFFLGSHSSMNTVAWYNKIPNLILYDEQTGKRHFERKDQWSFGMNYPETKHSVFEKFDISLLS